MPFCCLCGALLLWPLQVAIYLCKCQTPKDHVPRYRETNQTQCNGPYDTEEVHPY